MSVLFADLAGFTASAAAADPEDVAARLEAFHSAVREDIERFGGRIEKLIGDGVFAIFGAPAAHEDDAERAVRAALRLQKTLDDLNEIHALALSARVAVTTGEAMVRLAGTAQDQEGVVGDVVNTASRLQAVAPEGGVLVDQRTHAATHRITDYEIQEPIRIKGKPEPVQTWLATGMRSRFGVDVEVDDTIAFVGREDSLRLLVDSFERAVAGGTAQLVTISGEPGVGKTRLVSEFRRMMDDRPDLMWWRQGHCLPYGDGISFWALGEIVKAHAGVLDGEPTDVVRAKILAAADELIDDPEEARWVGARLLELIGVAAGESSRSERFTAWTQFLETLAGRNPLIMVVDDLHWADPALVQFLDELVEIVDGVALLVVATARPELYDAHPGWGGGKRNSTTIALGPLSEEHTAELVTMLDEAADPEAIASAVQRSGGNPLYATELVRMTADRQASGVGEGAIPESIHAVIAARIDLLSADDKEVLQVASVVGKVFWSGALAFAAGKPAETMEASLRRLSRRELIRRARRSSMRDQDEYSFWHDLIADVAYGQIARQTRRQIHESVGRWLEATSGDRIGEVAEILAHHFSKALELSIALGEDDERLVRAARRHLIEAARRSENVNADKAMALLDRALDLSDGPADEAEVLMRIATIQTSAVGGEAAVNIGMRAADAAARAYSTELQAEALSILSRAHWVAGDGVQCEAVTRELLELAGSMPDGPGLTTALSQAVGTRYLQGNFTGLQEMIDRALAVGERHGPRAEYLNVLKWAGTYQAESGDSQGIAQLRLAYQGAAELGDTRLQITAANNLASFLVNAEDVEEAIEICNSAISLGRSRGLLNIGDFTRLTLIEAFWYLGRWSDMVPEYEHLIDTYGSGSYSGQGGMGWRASHAVYTKHPRAREWSDEYLAIARRVQDHQAFVPALFNGIVSLAQLDLVEEALLLVREFEKVTDDRPVFRTQGLPMIGRILIEAGEIEWLGRLVEGLDPVGDGTDSFPRAVLARAEGDPDRALAYLDAALQVEPAVGSPWQQADVRIERAAVSIDLGRRTAAISDLDEAERLLRVVGDSVFDELAAKQRARL